MTDEQAKGEATLLRLETKLDSILADLHGLQTTIVGLDERLSAEDRQTRQLIEFVESQVRKNAETVAANAGSLSALLVAVSDERADRNAVAARTTALEAKTADNEKKLDVHDVALNTLSSTIEVDGSHWKQLTEGLQDVKSWQTWAIRLVLGAVIMAVLGLVLVQG